MQIMDVGCGNGLFFPKLGALGTVHGIEVDDSLIDPSGPFEKQISREPLGDDNYSDSFYDIVTALDVMEHIEDDYGFARNLLRILRPGGYLLLTVPAFQVLWDQHDVNNQHYRRYRKWDLLERFSSPVEVISCRYLFSCLFPAKFLIAQLNRRRSSKISQTRIPNRWINHLMIITLLLEHQLTRHLPIPFGTSTLLVLRKPL